MSEADARPRKTVGDRLRAGSFALGEVLITLGVVVLLFVLYEVEITSIFTRHDNQRIARKLEQTWEDPALTLPGISTKSVALGSGVANIYIPRFGADYRWTIVQGTGLTQLAEGPGHYTDSALPGAKGNFGIAGHRVSKGEPFNNLDKLRTNDAVIVETQKTWFVYRVLGSPAGADPQGREVSVKAETDAGKATTVRIPAREIVVPSAGRVLLPVPDHPNLQPVERLMTMTTCHPKYTAQKRMIVHAALAQSTSALDAAGKHSTAMPAAIKALYGQVTG